MKYNSSSLLSTIVIIASSTIAVAKETPPVLAKVSSIAINPLSVVRIQDRLNLMLEMKLEDGKRVQRWQAIDCKNNKAESLYWDLVGPEGKLEHRYYGKSYSHYAPPQPDATVPAENIAMVCSYKVKNVDWVYLEKHNKYSSSTLIDVANITKIKDLLMVRMGYGYTQIAYDPPFDAPHDLKIESHLYHCKEGKDMALVALDVDSNSYITDSLVDESIKARQSSFKLDADVEQTFKQLCAMDNPRLYKGQGKYVSAANKSVSKTLGPSMPVLTNNDPSWLEAFPLSENIHKQATDIIATWAKPKFKRVEYTEKLDGKPTKIIVDAMSDGLTRRFEDFGVFSVQRVMIANGIQLKSAISVSSSPSMTHKLTTNLRFPLYQGQKTEVKTQSKSPSGDEARMTVNCEVTTSGEASVLSPVFTGKYWEVSCKTVSTNETYSTKSAFVQDLNIYVPLTSMNGDGQERPVRLEDVKVTR